MICSLHEVWHVLRVLHHRLTDQSKQQFKASPSIAGCLMTSCREVYFCKLCSNTHSAAIFLSCSDYLACIVYWKANVLQYQGSIQTVVKCAVQQCSWSVPYNHCMRVVKSATNAEVLQARAAKHSKLSQMLDIYYYGFHGTCKKN